MLTKRVFKPFSAYAVTSHIVAKVAYFEKFCRKSVVKNPSFLTMKVSVSFQICKRIFLFLCRCFRIDIHRGRDIRMPHDFLNDFQIGFIFAAAGTERVPQIVNWKIPNQQWLPFFLFSQFHFIPIVISYNPFHCTIYSHRVMKILLPVQKNKIGISIYRRRFQLEPFLILTFLKQRFPHLWQHRNYTIASVRFGRCKTEPPTIVVTETVNNIMVVKISLFSKSQSFHRRPIVSPILHPVPSRNVNSGIQWL